VLQIKPERVTGALHNLDEWRKAVSHQGSMHLLPLLALLERGAAPTAAIVFNERPDEYDFWDRYFRLNDENEAKPYFNPISLKRAEKNYPHSNSATIRKNTFDLKWHGARREVQDGNDNWTLAENYPDIVRDYVLTKAGSVTRVPVVDLAAVMLRNRQFPDGAGARELETAFRATFSMSDDAFGKMFDFVDEDADRIFQADPPLAGYDEAILAALNQIDPKAGPLPPLHQSDDKLKEDDPILLQVEQILGMNTSGIILAGSPGTGKSYYAKQLSRHLTVNHASDIFRVQFHPSYGYEDFVEGYAPEQTATSGFKIVEKIFLKACKRARDTKTLVVLVIDEINRGDPARIFGELLTYLEKEYRGQSFALPFSGNVISIPANLLIIGTMNPHDRSVSHIDAAFVRRFDHIDMAPSREVVELLLEGGGGFSPEQVKLIGDWFERAQTKVPFGLGHSFFSGVKDVDALQLVWRYRIKPTAATAIEVNEGRLADLTASFEALVRRLKGQVGEG
jgi:5-methylcytosine-specific restriction enzyme B